MTQESGSFVGACEVRIDASPETVFGFLVDPDKMALWMGVSHELDPRPGGVFRVAVVGDAAVASGTYLAVEPFHRVVFTWGWEGGHFAVAPGSSVVEIVLEPDGDGTVLQLTHSALPSELSVTEHGKGWTHYLDRLRIAAAGGDPGRDTNLP